MISGDLYDILSSPMQKVCREIDTVTVKGSIKPMRLFTIDVQTEDLERTQDPLHDKNLRDKKSLRDRMRNELLEKLFSGKETTWSEFNSDYEFIELRKYVDPEFEEFFAESYKHYINGDWEKAGPAFKELVEWRPKDGPAVNLNKVINLENHGVAPPDWKGYRPLTSK